LYKTKIKHRLIRIYRCSRYFIAFAIIGAALLSSLVRGLTPWVAQYRQLVEKYLSQALSEKVVIGKMETGWYWFQPVVRLNDLGIFKHNYSVIEAQNLTLGINLWRSLWHWQLEPGILYLENLHLTVHQNEQGVWMVDGISSKDKPNFLENLQKNPQLLAWLLADNKIIIKHSTLEVYLHDGTLIPVQHVNFLLANQDGTLELRGRIQVGRSHPTMFTVAGDLALHPENALRIDGLLYIACRNLQLSQWQEFINLPRGQILNGLVDGKWWLTFHQGKIDQAQAQVAIQNLWAYDAQLKKHIQLDRLEGNLAWEASTPGWKLTADQLVLALQGQNWPVDAISLQYDASEKVWTLYIKQVMLKAIDAIAEYVPEKLHPLLQLRLQGNLEDTKIQWGLDHLQSVLTHFSGLGWQSYKDYPSIKDISGVFYWLPTKGRLVLDGENTRVVPKGLPASIFQDLNMALRWEVYNQGWHFDLERLVIRHPHLALQATGRWDNLRPPEKATMQFTGQLSASQVKRWFAYLPKGHMKPKLYTWLTQGITRFDSLTADFTVQGIAQDFPFDQAPGTFTIESHLQGVDLFFAPQWPLTKNMDAFLQVKNRRLSADIVQADLDNIPIKALNLNVDDLGLNHETLLVHGEVHTNGPKALAYLQHSPLAKKMRLLQILKVKGLLDLDLHLEAPLYHGNDKLLVLGDLMFHQSNLDIEHHLGDFSLQHFNGHLAFNDAGALDSHLTAKGFGAPLDIHIFSGQTPTPNTTIELQGKIAVDALRKQWANPCWDWISGQIPLESQLIIPYASGDLEHIVIRSNLQGATVDLPPILGKKTDQQASVPLALDFDFTTPQLFKLKGLWGVASDPLDVQAQHAQDNWTVRLKNSHVDGTIQYAPKTSVLQAQLRKLYWPKSTDTEVGDKQPALSTLSVANLPNVTLTIDDFRWDNWNMGAMQAKATRTKNAWVVDSLEIKNSAYVLQAEGQWQQQPRESSASKTSRDVVSFVNNSQAKVYVQVKQLAQALVQFEVSPIMDAKKGSLSAELTWPGGFHEIGLKTLAGKADLNIQDGVISHFDVGTEEKLGLGKLLSLLSLQTIPRRLKLDFSDLVHGGYAFDVFRGNFSIKQGVMTTADTYIDGPIATANIEGNLNVPQQLYDFKVKIAPHITASLPIVATIAGGPIAGAATWVASKVLNQTFQKIYSYSYQVTGPWKKPDIQSIKGFHPSYQPPAKLFE
jgi:uncharacterized protein YhdP